MLAVQAADCDQHVQSFFCLAERCDRHVFILFRPAWKMCVGSTQFLAVNSKVNVNMESYVMY